MTEVIVRGGTILTMDEERRVTAGDVAISDGRLVQVGGDYVPQHKDYEIIDAGGCLVMPGLVQTHVHTCQTLARGRADNLDGVAGMHQVVWPHEGAMTFEDVAAAARLACAELLLGGTTAILDMAPVHHTDAVFEAARDSGIRATIGKSMMDGQNDAIPAPLRESTRESLDESAQLLSRWHGRCNDRLRYAFSPRGALSCTEELLRALVELAASHEVLIHTHANENRAEIAEVKRRTGRDNIEYLNHLGLCSSKLCVAHCVWLADGERNILRDTGTHVLHCPSSNLKLGSGVAPVPELLAAGVGVSLGSDGAPRNNNLDAFAEMRLAALIHKPRVGPLAMPAATVLGLATQGGANALGLGEEIGSLEVGKRADVIVVEASSCHTVPCEDPYSLLVYASRSSDVRDVVVDGRILVRDRKLLSMDEAAVATDARTRARALFSGR